MTLPELDVRCWKCWGEGVVANEDHGDMVPCSACGGVGWIPTDEGRRLLDFIERHLVFESGEEEEDQMP